jgi:type III pantothenate kinase
MNALYLDIGNTSLKLASPGEAGWEVLWHEPFGVNFESFVALINRHAEGGMSVIHISSVRKDITRKIREAAPGIDFQVLSATQIPDHKINYSTVQTLGLDRFLGCLGAYHISNNHAVIVIDTGSACTVDFMDDSGVYQGGVIMPGLDLLKKSIRRYLPELPAVDSIIPENWPGKSTQDSLRWGVNGMLRAAIESWIVKFKELDGNARTFLTGGNSSDLQRLLANTECIRHANLQFEGMKIFVDEISE